MKPLTHNQKDNLWGMIIIGFLICCTAMCPADNPARAESKDSYYQVEVDIRVGNCSTTKTFTVRARSSFDAKDEAERVGQLSVNTRARTVKQVN